MPKYNSGQPPLHADGAEEDNDNDKDEEEEMPNARVPPHRPPAAAAHQQSAFADIDGIAKAMGQASLRDGRQFTAFNFNYHFPVIWIIAGPLADGHMVVYGDYLTPTLHLTRYNCTMSEDGLTATLSMELLSVYTDVHGRAEAGEHGARGADKVLFIAGARNTTDSIAAVYDNLDGITPPGQQDPLPFPCGQCRDITHVYHEGDILLNQDIANQPSFQRMGVGRQLYAFVCVAFVSVYSKVLKVGCITTPQVATVVLAVAVLASVMAAALAVAVAVEVVVALALEVVYQQQPW